MHISCYVSENVGWFIYVVLDIYCKKEIESVLFFFSCFSNSLSILGFYAVSLLHIVLVTEQFFNTK